MQWITSRQMAFRAASDDRSPSNLFPFRQERSAFYSEILNGILDVARQGPNGVDIPRRLVIH